MRVDVQAPSLEEAFRRALQAPEAHHDALRDAAHRYAFERRTRGVPPEQMISELKTQLHWAAGPVLRTPADARVVESVVTEVIGHCIDGYYGELP